MPQSVLAVNVGLKSARAIIFDQGGRALARSSLPIETTLRGACVEQSAVEWWEKVCAVIRAVTEDRALAATIGLATVTCSSSCLVAVDEALAPLGPVLMVSDRRAEAEAEAVGASPAFQALAERRGFRASSSLHLPRILWLKREQPELYRRVHRFLSPNDFLVGKLTGVLVTDTLNAEKAYFDRELGGYPEALYQAFDVSLGLLPPVRSPGAEVGEVHPELCAGLGLPTSVRVRLATYDAICSVFGTGLSESGMVCDVSGTVSSVRLFSQTPRADPSGRLFCQRFEPADCYLIGGSNNLGGGLIEWAKQCLYQSESSPYEVMEREARESSPGAKGLLFLPSLLGARAPRWDSTARGVFFGLERYHSRGDMMRAVFEATGLGVREFTDLFGRGDEAPRSISASGGLARINLVNELKADITGVEYRVVDEFESSALGAVIIALVAEGTFPSYRAATAAAVQTHKILLPRPHLRRLYDDLYRLYEQVYESLGPAFQERARQMEQGALQNLEHIENL